MQHSRATKLKISATLRRLCKDPDGAFRIAVANGMRRFYRSPEGRRSCKERAKKIADGVRRFSCSPEGRRNYEARAKKISEALTGRKLSSEHRRKMSLAALGRDKKNVMRNCKRGYVITKKGTPRRMYYHSSWELLLVKCLEADTTVTSFVREPFAVLYKWDGVIHRIRPDFLVKYKDGRQVVTEVKGSFHPLGRQHTVVVVAAMKNYCKRHSDYEFQLLYARNGQEFKKLLVENFPQAVRVLR